VHPLLHPPGDHCTRPHRRPATIAFTALRRPSLRVPYHPLPQIIHSFSPHTASIAPTGILPPLHPLPQLSDGHHCTCSHSPQQVGTGGQALHHQATSIRPPPSYHRHTTSTIRPPLHLHTLQAAALRIPMEHKPFYVLLTPKATRTHKPHQLVDASHARA
jgi:hypothetical protein